MDPWRRTRILYQDQAGQLFMTGLGPESMREFEQTLEEKGLTILLQKPFILGDEFTDGETTLWKEAA